MFLLWIYVMKSHDNPLNTDSYFFVIVLCESSCYPDAHTTTSFTLPKKQQIRENSESLAHGYGSTMFLSEHFSESNSQLLH